MWFLMAEKILQVQALKNHFQVQIYPESTARTINAASRGLQLPAALPTEKPNKDGFGYLHWIPARGVIRSTCLRLAARILGPVVLVQ